MGIYMATRSIVRLVSCRFSTAGKVVPKGEKVAETSPTKKRDLAWEFYEQGRLDAAYKRGQLIDFGFRFMGVYAIVAAIFTSAENGRAEAKAMDEKTTEAMGEKTPDNVGLN